MELIFFLYIIAVSKLLIQKSGLKKNRGMIGKEYRSFCHDVNTNMLYLIYNKSKKVIGMDNKKALWGSQQNLLRSIILKPDKFDEAIKLCLRQHAMVHSSAVSREDIVTFEDELWQGLDDATFRTITPKESSSIAWHMWHVTRIEDMTMNILVADEAQVINTDRWIEKMNVEILDTGNAMTVEEVARFSTKINMDEFREYRIAVGRKTREIIKNLRPEDLKRKVKKDGLQRILSEGGVLDVPGSKWLIDFWGRKNAAGILLMPVTRHNMVHINQSMEIKRKCR